jgi:hypothetical protein
MSRSSKNADQQGGGGRACKAASPGLPILLFLTAEELSQGRIECEQLRSVIHQVFQNPLAQQRLREDPDRFISRLKVRPRVKAILWLMKATLLAQHAVNPQFSWWWGAAPPDEDDTLTTRPGSSPLPVEKVDPDRLLALA